MKVDYFLVKRSLTHQNYINWFLNGKVISCSNIQRGIWNLICSVPLVLKTICFYVYKPFRCYRVDQRGLNIKYFCSASNLVFYDCFLRVLFFKFCLDLFWFWFHLLERAPRSLLQDILSNGRVNYRKQASRLFCFVLFLLKVWAWGLLRHLSYHVGCLTTDTLRQRPVKSFTSS